MKISEINADLTTLENLMKTLEAKTERIKALQAKQGETDKQINAIGERISEIRKRADSLSESINCIQHNINK